MSSSRFSFVILVLRNAAPRYGMSPKNGSLRTRLSSCVPISPPMMIVCPFCTLTVVFARRWLMMGTVADLLISTVELLMAELVVPNSSFTNPSGLIFGVTVRFTPMSS